MSEWRDRFEDSRAAVGSEAIRADAPAGKPVRDSEAFTLVEDELHKLETQGPTAVRWPNVRDRALDILREEGKDLLPACWLCLALYKVEGFHGLATGLLILDGMCQTFWDDMQPPPQRARGRANVFDWLSERISPLLENADTASEDDVAIVTAYEAAQALTDLVSEKLSIDTTLSILLRSIRTHANPARERLEQAAAALEAQAQAEEAAAVADAGGPTEPGAAEAAPGAASDEAAAGAERATAPAPQPQSGTPQPATPQPSPAAAAPAPSLVIDNADAERAVTQVTEAMARVARQLRDASKADPRAYALLRTASWSRVVQVPDADRGRTAMPAPPRDMVATLETAFSAGNYVAVIEQAEALQHDRPFFLTASRWTSAALRALGPDHEAAATTVDGQTEVFLRRFPDLLSMTFADGTPFADAETVSWIQSTQSGGGGGEADPTQEAAAQARSLLASGKGTEAMALLVKSANGAASGRERFKWRLAQASLCLEAGRVAEAVALADALVENGSGVHLAEYEPSLLARAAEVRLMALQHQAATAIYPEDELTRRRAAARSELVKVDAARAFACGV